MRYKTLILIGAMAGALGCQATAPAPAPETVGELAPSYRSIAVQPTHATTDLSGGFVAVDTDAGPSVVEHEDAAAPDIAAKTGGLRAGEVR